MNDLVDPESVYTRSDHFSYAAKGIPIAFFTTGLHPDDVKKLLAVLNRLVDAGHTVLVVEHNLDVVKTADWVIDLGPEGGDLGGEVVAAGPPEAIAVERASHTGRALQKYL